MHLHYNVQFENKKGYSFRNLLSSTLNSGIKLVFCLLKINFNLKDEITNE